MCRYLSRYIPFVQLQGIFHLYLGGYVLEDVNYNLNNSMHRYARKCRLKSEPWYHLSMRRLHWTLRCWSGWRRAPWLGDTSRTWWGCCTVLYCTVLYCTVLYCTVLYFTVLYCTWGSSRLGRPSFSSASVKASSLLWRMLEEDKEL